MSNLKSRSLGGEIVTLAPEALAALAASLRGETTSPADEAYESQRAIWNAMVDRRPSLIVRCAGVADVLAALRWVKEHGLAFSVRGGGHNIAGNALCDEGVLIDLSGMRSVRVDPQRRVAQVEPGATLGDLDHETQAFGLAAPVGINSTTGVAGLTLGGGFGWLSRKHGLTIDNLLSADVVTADGELVRASAEENPELFWGLRGGGGNFGIVTSFELRLHPVGPEVRAGLFVYPRSEARSVLHGWRAACAEASEELSAWVVMRKAPPLPFLPEEVHGTDVVVIAAMWSGDAAAGEKAMAPLQELGTPVGVHAGPMPFVAWQQAFDPLLTPGARNYWKSHDFSELTDTALDELIERAGRLPSDQTEIFVAQLGGAVTRVAADATAYAGRDAVFIMNVHARWTSPSEDEACIAWARELFTAMEPHATGGVYVNFMPDDEADRVRAAYGPNFERLAALKAAVDPDNLFSVNQNVAPGAKA